MTDLRRVEPEWLDQMPPHDPRARRSRRDLELINVLMMNDAIVARALARSAGRRAPRAIAEIGAGDGTFMRRLVRKGAFGRDCDAQVVLLDRQPLVADATVRALTALGCHVRIATADALEWLARPSTPVFDVMIANLFLHHFDDVELGSLLARVAARSRVFVACEPRRSKPALAAARLLWAIGCNDVSRHDAAISVRAGFAGRELTALWPAGGGWTLRESAAAPFSHCFVAARDAGGLADRDATESAHASV